VAGGQLHDFTSTINSCLWAEMWYVIRTYCSNMNRSERTVKVTDERHKPAVVIIYRRSRRPWQHAL